MDIHGILQNMGLYPPTENPCLMMIEKRKTRCSEYVVVYHDDLYIASQTAEGILNTLH